MRGHYELPYTYIYFKFLQLLHYLILCLGWCCFLFLGGMLWDLLSLVSPGSYKVLDCHLVLLSIEVLYLNLPPKVMIACFSRHVISVVFIIFLKAKDFYVWCIRVYPWFWATDLFCEHGRVSFFLLVLNNKNIIMNLEWIPILVRLLSQFRQWNLSKFKHLLSLFLKFQQSSVLCPRE